MENNKEIIYGVNSIGEVIRSCGTKRFCKIILSETKRPDRRIKLIAAIAEDKKIPIEIRSKSFIDSVTGTEKNQGIAGILYKKRMLSLKELLIAVEKKNKRYPTLLIADSIEDPRNLGALIRSAYALCIDGLILPRRRTSGITPAVYKTSAGAVEYFEICSISSILNTITILKKKGYTIASLDMTGGIESYNADLLVPLAIIIGGENRGIGQAVKKKSDWIISIPQYGSISSLNVSCAGSVIFYEILRQKKLKNNV